MRTLSFEGFLQDFGNAAPNTMNMSIYRDSFHCACGRSHWFDESIDVVCQGSLMKVMVTCPEDPSYITSLKIKTFMLVKFKGFDSLAGTRISSDEDALTFTTLRQYMRRR